MSENIDPNMMHRRRCCICQLSPVDYKCDHCNIYYCVNCDEHIFYHVDNNSAHSPYRYDYYKCCANCCSNCYTVQCHICTNIDSNLEMKLVNGQYQCPEHE